tara:strand:- start:154 stop:270 length:117 start_codon:yes stop_codon:yes gene_type:complete
MGRINTGASKKFQQARAISPNAFGLLQYLAILLKALSF